MPNRDQIHDAMALLPAGQTGTSRRTVLQAAMASGLFAAAVQPVSAQTMIVTSTDGLEAGDGRFFCCDHCAEKAGVKGLRDRV